ncbi:acyl-CoA thioesterase [Salisaeta longa]|uniref:acyl-CoA thioesterase n=1 Tax=Salisaeta longa TaxID=503170 RepID=UPI0003B3A112|nr:thioesterase family protein [Salisaeta longa]
MYTHTYRHRVRYRECDPMGVVYHTHYLDYFEMARTEALRAAGVAYRTLEENGIIMPVVEASVDYKQPAQYDDLLAVEAIFEALPTVRVPIRYRVRRAEAPEVLVTGRTTLCFMDAARRRPVRIPPMVHAAFAPHFESTS